MSHPAATDARSVAAERFFAAEAPRLAELCQAMAERFARGGRLLACGRSDADWSDARHVAVEFVHPVIVGKRALPALALPVDEVGRHAGPDDMVIAFGDPPDTDCLLITFAPPTDDPFVAQELVETAYHVLWELVHVFFDHLPGSGAGTGASSFLYPFLGAGEQDLDAVRADVEASVLAKAADATALREQTLSENHEVLVTAASALRGAGTILALGNGGSATDAMDAVADLRAGGIAIRALDLTADAPILTAVANDIGTEAMFARQVIAYGQPGDGLLAFSTSGGSANVIAALAEGRRRGLVTVAFVGYDGGSIAAEGLADHVVISRSEHIPRIQEAQASAWHVLRELVITAER
ncbi:MAG: D-sedoheptulose 7-phosphate isomerase [Solirubrobacteraceae bacterium]|jgi:D-sedoheptulose 7-phosphate isomerase|nr:D-sedoheptulose 7-phosphate isomerase [Solirubrobacteraceae bacterium]